MDWIADALRCAAYAAILAAVAYMLVDIVLHERKVNRRHAETMRVLASLCAENPHARWLGRTVEARVYEGSDWERMVVVAVSWKGSLAVRPERDMQTKARWIRKQLVGERVREIGEGDNG